MVWASDIGLTLILYDLMLTQKFSCDKVNQKKEGKCIVNVMPIPELIDKVAQICKKNGVKRLDLFGSFATGTAAPTSDIDFVVYGCRDIGKLEMDLEEIDTLRKIDIFDYDSIHNEYLLEDIKKYGKQIF